MPSSSGKKKPSSSGKKHETSGKKMSGSSGNKSDSPGNKPGSSSQKPDPPGKKSDSSSKKVIEVELDDEDLPSYDDAMASGPRIFEAPQDDAFRVFHRTREFLTCVRAARPDPKTSSC